VGHLSHLVGADLIVVLRCRPSVLEERLKGRRYSQAKVRENMEAEGCDVILIEAMEGSAPVFEIDTTERTPEQVADAIGEILAGEKEKYEPGHIDWSEEVLGWY
jgi:adenylate kinase